MARAKLEHVINCCGTSGLPSRAEVTDAAMSGRAECDLCGLLFIPSYRSGETHLNRRECRAESAVERRR